MWYTFEIQFRLGTSIFETTEVISGESERDAFGKAWAKLLLQRPGAIYHAHATV